MFALLRPFGLLLVLASVPAAVAQSPESGQAEEGYLLAEKLHSAPDPFSDEVEAVGRDERVRVVPAPEAVGWSAIYRVSDDTLVGYAFRPYVSRLGSSDLASLQQPDGSTIPQSAPTAESASGSNDKLASVVFTEGLTAADGVLTQVERWANVRQAPGISSEAFGVIRPFTPFRVVSLDRGWGKVLLQGEPSVGYVSGSLLHSVDEPIAERETPESASSESEPGFTLRGEAAGGGTSLGGATVGDPNTSEEDEEPVIGEEELTGTVYVTRTGRKYHRASCKHLRSVKFAMPLAEAMLDFAPCRSCTPPTRVMEETPQTPDGQ